MLPFLTNQNCKFHHHVLQLLKKQLIKKNMFTNFTGECQSNSSWPVALEGFADATVTQCTQVNQQLNR